MCKYAPGVGSWTLPLGGTEEYSDSHCSCGKARHQHTSSADTETGRTSMSSPGTDVMPNGADLLVTAD